MTDLGGKLDISALRYVRAFERGEIDHVHGHCLTVGNAAGILVEDAFTYAEGYEAAEDAGVFICAGPDSENAA